MPLLTLIVNGTPVTLPLPADPFVSIEIKTSNGISVEIKTGGVTPTITVDGVVRS